VKLSFLQKFNAFLLIGSVVIAENTLAHADTRFAVLGIILLSIGNQLTNLWDSITNQD
jgi:5-methylthioribose kinase